MVSDSESFEGEYKIETGELTSEQINKIAKIIESSDEFDMGKLGRIVLKGTNLPIGLLGTTFAELYFPENPDSRYEEAHEHLRRIYNSV